MNTQDCKHFCISHIGEVQKEQIQLKLMNGWCDHRLFSLSGPSFPFKKHKLEENKLNFYIWNLGINKCFWWVPSQELQCFWHKNDYIFRCQWSHLSWVNEGAGKEMMSSSFSYVKTVKPNGDFGVLDRTEKSPGKVPLPPASPVLQCSWQSRRSTNELLNSLKQAWSSILAKFDHQHRPNKIQSLKLEIPKEISIWSELNQSYFHNKEGAKSQEHLCSCK